MTPGTLYVVSTPIGNLGDITFRAVETLKAVQVVLAEDTRQTRVLLNHFGIKVPMVSLHEHNESASIPRVLKRLADGDSAALVSDAGTPLLSDPGQRLVAAVWAAGLTVVPVPGPSALTAALAGAGLDTSRFTFFGFLPRSGRERTEALQTLSALPHLGVLYEAPARLAKTLSELDTLGAGDRGAVVARELTKRFEEFRRGTVAELATYYAESPPRGEVVVIIEGRTAEPVSESTLQELVREMKAGGRTARDIVAVLCAEHGVARNMAYRLAHES